MDSTKKYRRNGIDYIGANNLIISIPRYITEDGSSSIDEELIVRYKSPKGTVSENIYIPKDKTNESHKKALYALWKALKNKIKNAKENEDLNPYRIINSAGFSGKFKDKNDPQMSLFASKLDDISNSLENKGLIKEAYQLDIIANMLDILYNSNKSHSFFDELSNFSIDPEIGTKVLDIANELELIK